MQLQQDRAIMMHLGSNILYEVQQLPDFLFS